MPDTNHRLTPKRVSGAVKLASPGGSASNYLSTLSPAIAVMTDLTLVKPIQIADSTSIDDANEKMIATGVRLLFVHNQKGELNGLITSFDILGEKPMLFITHNGGSRNDIEAKDIMTPISEFEGIAFSELEKSVVADVVAALEDSSRHHMLIVQNEGESVIIRGLISSTHVARVLGKEITPSQRAESFAQLNRALK